MQGLKPTTGRPMAFLGLFPKNGTPQNRLEYSGRVGIIKEVLPEDQALVYYKPIDLEVVVDLLAPKRFTFPVNDIEPQPLDVETYYQRDTPARKFRWNCDQTDRMRERLKTEPLKWPIVVGEHSGVIGHHRLKAAQRLGWKTIPGYVVPEGTTKMFRGM